MRRLPAYIGVAIALFLALVTTEALKSDAPVSIWDWALDLIDMALLATAVVVTSHVSVEMREARAERANLLNDLARARADGDHWRSAARVHIDGLGRAIREQFDRWKLTAGEADVATLMLKGLSHKEIANLRNSSAATVRQQATAVYGKSGLTSRAELAAFFLEDVFAPDAKRSDPPKRDLTLVDGNPGSVGAGRIPGKV